MAGRYESAKRQLEAYQAEIMSRKVKRDRIEAFLKTLSKSETLITEFDEGLWNTMVETLTVYSYSRIVFLFRDGTEIEWKIRK